MKHTSIFLSLALVGCTIEFEKTAEELAEENNNNDQSAGDSTEGGQSDTAPSETDTAVEEPASEPTSEPSIEDTGYTNSYTINPDSVLFSFMNSYVENDIAPIMFTGSSEAFSGSFSLILFDSAAGDFCAVDWSFDANSSYADQDYGDGSVACAFQDCPDIEGWYGFTVSSTPETRGSCDALSADWAQSLDAIVADQPGFGYGPLTADLQASMETEPSFDWANAGGSVFTGIASMTVFSQDGSRAYFPVNQAFAYTIENDVPAFDPSVQDLPQGTEMAIADVPFAPGFYYGDYYFGLSFQ
jgi:hypothetical protein